MRTLLRFSLVRVLLTAAVLVAAMAVARHATAHLADGALIAAAPLMLGPLRGFGKTYDLLKSLMKPAQADQPESIPHVLYDSQPYAAAGQAAPLTFFNSATQANLGDITLSNFPTGTLEGGYYFEVHRVHAIIDSIPATTASTAITGPANDVEIIHKTARGTLFFNMKGKIYGPTKLAYFGRPGGPVPEFKIFGTAAAASTQVGNTENNGGFPYLGNIIIPPVTQFKGTLQFQPTLVPISALTLITVALMGILHRPVS